MCEMTLAVTRTEPASFKRLCTANLCVKNKVFKCFFCSTSSHVREELNFLPLRGQRKSYTQVQTLIVGSVASYSSSVVQVLALEL